MYKPTYNVIVNGKEMELYTISTVAKKLNVSTYTIRLWERKKIIPRAMFRKDKLRLWHPDEVRVIKRELKRAQKGKSGKWTDWEGFQKTIWPALREIRLEILGQNEQA